MSMSLPKLTAVHYLFTRKRDDRWIAHCLDFDIVTGAGTEDEAEDRLDRLVSQYIEDALRSRNYPMLSTVAPREFWKQYHEAFTAKRTRPARRPLTIRVPVQEFVFMEEVQPQPSGQIEVLSVAA